MVEVIFVSVRMNVKPFHITTDGCGVPAIQGKMLNIFTFFDLVIKSDTCADIFCASKLGEMLKTWFGVPAVTQISSNFSSVSSKYMGQGVL